MYISNKVAEKIKEVAKKRNVSIKQLLNDVNLGFNTMSNMKTSMPKADNLAKIADYLDCSVDYLLGRVDEPAMTYNSLPQQDKAILSAYHSQPRLQPAVDKLLGIGSEEYNFSGMDLSHAQVAAFGGTQQPDSKIDYSALSEILSEDDKE